MAVTQNQYTGNGSTVLYSFTFPYLATTDVKVKLDGVTQATTTYSLANATTVQMNTAPANGVVVLIFRDTDNDNKKATFYPGSAIKAEDLNDNIDQILYVAQEVDNNAMSTLGDDAMQGDLSLGNNKITNLGNPVSGSDGVNKTTLDATIDTALESDVLVGTDLSKSASSGQVTISHNVTGANTTINNSAGNVLQDITISAQGHVTSAGSTNLDDRYYTETELDAGQLDNRYFTETELSGGQLNNLYYTETELDGGQLDNRYFTETELNNGQLDNRYFTEAELNNGQLDTRYFRQDSSETITSGATWSGSDNFIATTAAIDARIVDLVDDVGGFVPIANETSFPATNPDVNNGTGTLVSIKTMSSARTPSGGSIVITDGAGSGNDVTITGLGTTVLPAGYGVIVETTGTTHTYTFHRLSPDATSVTAVSAIPNEIATVAGISSHVQTVSGINNDVQVVGANSSNVTTVAGSITSVNTAASNLDQIQNFANVYRIVSSDPTTSLNAGDLIFNTSTNKFKVYTGAAWVDAVARQFSDNTKMLFGDGNDLQIYHNGTDSIINAGSNGDFYLLSDNNLILQSASGGEVFLKATKNSGTELYHDASKKFETTSSGATVTGSLTTDGFTSTTSGDAIFTGTTSGRNAKWDTSHDRLIFDDNATAVFGSGADLQIYHNGSNSYIDNTTGNLYFRGSNGQMLFRPNNSEDALILKPNGSVELYYDNVKKFETTSAGAILSNSSADSVLKINRTDTLSDNDNIGTLLFLGKKSDGADHTYGFIKSTVLDVTTGTTDSKLTFATKTNGSDKEIVFQDGSVYLSDNGKATFGTSADLQLFHDGGNAHFANTTGTFKIKGNDIHLQNAAGNEDYITATANGAVELYYDNNKKFETTSSGVAITGGITTTTNSTFDGNYQTFTGANYNAFWDKAGNYFKFVDNAKAVFGSTQDLQIYHDGTDSFIKNTTGNLIIGDTTGNVILQGKFGEDSLICKPDGSVELNYDNDKVFYTETRGVRIGDNTKIFENAAHNTGIIQHADIHHSIIFRGSTNADGTTITNGNVTTFREYGNFVFRTGQINALERLIIESNGTSRFVNNNDSTNEEIAKFNPNGSVELYYDNSKKLETTSIGIDVTGKVTTDELSVIKTSGNLSAHFEAQSGLGTLEIGGSTGAFIDLKTPFSDDFDLRVDANGNLTSSGNIALVVQGNENGLRVLANGAVELYYDNSKKLETQSYGVDITGNLFMPDSSTGNTGRIKLGDQEDLQIYHTGANATIDANSGNLYIRSQESIFLQPNATENAISCITNGAVELYYDNVKKFNTSANGGTFSGNLFFGDGGSGASDNKITFGNGSDFQIYHDGSNSYLDETGTGDLIIQSSHIVFKDGGTQVFETTNSGVRLLDNIKLVAGSGNDLQIYHDGTKSYIQDSGTGSLRILSNDLRIYNAANDEFMARFVENNAVELYYDSSKKLYTHPNGIFVQGIYPMADNNYNIGSSTQRFINIYATNGSIQTSDRNEKNTIVNSDLGLDFINKLNPISYKWNENDGKTHYGLIAQDVEETLTSLGKTNSDFGGIHKKADSPMGLNYSELIGPLIKALQEATTKIETLETKVAALEAK